MKLLFALIFMHLIAVPTTLHATATFTEGTYIGQGPCANLLSMVATRPPSQMPGTCDVRVTFTKDKTNEFGDTLGGFHYAVIGEENLTLLQSPGRYWAVVQLAKVLFRFDSELDPVPGQSYPFADIVDNEIILSAGSARIPIHKDSGSGTATILDAAQALRSETQVFFDTLRDAPETYLELALDVRAYRRALEGFVQEVETNSPSETILSTWTDTEGTYQEVKTQYNVLQAIERIPSLESTWLNLVVAREIVDLRLQAIR